MTNERSSPIDDLERLKTETERWVGCVAGDGATAGGAAHEIRKIVDRAYYLGDADGWRAATLKKAKRKKP